MIEDNKIVWREDGCYSAISLRDDEKFKTFVVVNDTTVFVHTSKRVYELILSGDVIDLILILEYQEGKLCEIPQ